MVSPCLENLKEMQLEPWHRHLSLTSPRHSIEASLCRRAVVCLNHQEACILTELTSFNSKSRSLDLCNRAGRATFATDPSETEHMTSLFNGPHIHHMPGVGVTQGPNSVALTVFNAPGLEETSIQCRASDRLPLSKQVSS